MKYRPVFPRLSPPDKRVFFCSVYQLCSPSPSRMGSRRFVRGSDNHEIRDDHFVPRSSTIETLMHCRWRDFCCPCNFWSVLLSPRLRCSSVKKKSMCIILFTIEIINYSSFRRYFVKWNENTSGNVSWCGMLGNNFPTLWKIIWRYNI